MDTPTSFGNKNFRCNEDAVKRLGVRNYLKLGNLKRRTTQQFRTMKRKTTMITQSVLEQIPKDFSNCKSIVEANPLQRFASQEEISKFMEIDEIAEICFTNQQQLFEYWDREFDDKNLFTLMKIAFLMRTKNEKRLIVQDSSLRADLENKTIEEYESVRDFKVINNTVRNSRKVGILFYGTTSNAIYARCLGHEHNLSKNKLHLNIAYDLLRYRQAQFCKTCPFLVQGDKELHYIHVPTVEVQEKEEEEVDSCLPVIKKSTKKVVNVQMTQIRPQPELPIAEETDLEILEDTMLNVDSIVMQHVENMKEAKRVKSLRFFEKLSLGKIDALIYLSNNTVSYSLKTNTRITRPYTLVRQGKFFITVRRRIKIDGKLQTLRTKIYSYNKSTKEITDALTTFMIEDREKHQYEVQNSTASSHESLGFLTTVVIDIVKQSFKPILAVNIVSIATGIVSIIASIYSLYKNSDMSNIIIQTASLAANLTSIVMNILMIRKLDSLAKGEILTLANRMATACIRFFMPYYVQTRNQPPPSNSSSAGSIGSAFNLNRLRNMTQNASNPGIQVQDLSWSTIISVGMGLVCTSVILVDKFTGTSIAKDIVLGNNLAKAVKDVKKDATEMTSALALEVFGVYIGEYQSTINNLNEYNNQLDEYMALSGSEYTMDVSKLSRFKACTREAQNFLNDIKLMRKDVDEGFLNLQNSLHAKLASAKKYYKHMYDYVVRKGTRVEPIWINFIGRQGAGKTHYAKNTFIPKISERMRVGTQTINVTLQNSQKYFWPPISDEKFVFIDDYAKFGDNDPLHPVMLNLVACAPFNCEAAHVDEKNQVCIAECIVTTANINYLTAKDMNSSQVAALNSRCQRVAIINIDQKEDDTRDEVKRDGDKNLEIRWYLKSATPSSPSVNSEHFEKTMIECMDPTTFADPYEIITTEQLVERSVKMWERRRKVYEDTCREQLQKSGVSVAPSNYTPSEAPSFLSAASSTETLKTAINIECKYCRDDPQLINFQRNGILHPMLPTLPGFPEWVAHYIKVQYNSTADCDKFIEQWQLYGIDPKYILQQHRDGKIRETANIFPPEEIQVQAGGKHYVVMWTGPSGSGKSEEAKKVALLLSKRFKMPVYNLHGPRSFEKYQIDRPSIIVTHDAVYNEEEYSTFYDDLPSPSIIINTVNAQIVQRWRSFSNYGDTYKTKTWSEAILNSLVAVGNTLRSIIKGNYVQRILFQGIDRNRYPRYPAFGRRSGVVGSIEHAGEQTYGDPELNCQIISTPLAVHEIQGERGVTVGQISEKLAKNFRVAFKKLQQIEFQQEPDIDLTVEDPADVAIYAEDVNQLVEMCQDPMKCFKAYQNGKKAVLNELPYIQLTKRIEESTFVFTPNMFYLPNISTASEELVKALGERTFALLTTSDNTNTISISSRNFKVYGKDNLIRFSVTDLNNISVLSYDIQKVNDEECININRNDDQGTHFVDQIKAEDAISMLILGEQYCQVEMTDECRNFIWSQEPLLRKEAQLRLLFEKIERMRISKVLLEERLNIFERIWVEVIKRPYWSLMVALMGLATSSLLITALVRTFSSKEQPKEQHPFAEALETNTECGVFRYYDTVDITYKEHVYRTYCHAEKDSFKIDIDYDKSQYTSPDDFLAGVPGLVPKVMEVYARRVYAAFRKTYPENQIFISLNSFSDADQVTVQTYPEPNSQNNGKAKRRYIKATDIKIQTYDSEIKRGLGVHKSGEKPKKYHEIKVREQSISTLPAINTCTDDTTEVICRKIFKNTVRLHNINTANALHGVFLKDKFILCNGHLVAGFEDEVYIEMDQLSHLPFEERKAKVLAIDRENDVALLVATSKRVPAFTDITNYFILEKHVPEVSSTVLCAVRNQAETLVAGQSSYLVNHPHYPITVGNVTHQIQNPVLQTEWLSSSFRTVRGDCGFLVVSSESKHGSGRICGMHFAIVSSSARANVLTYEYIKTLLEAPSYKQQNVCVQEYANQLEDISTILSPYDGRTMNNEVPLLVDQEVEEVWNSLEEPRDTFSEVFGAEKKIHLLGYYHKSKKSWQGGKSRFTKSRYFDTIVEEIPQSKDIAPCRIEEVEDTSGLIKSDLGRPSILMTQVSYINDPYIFDSATEQVFKEATEAVTDFYDQIYNFTYRPLTHLEIINGTCIRRDEYFTGFERMDLDSAAGWTSSQKFGINVKRPLFKKLDRSCPNGNDLYDFADTKPGRYLREKCETVTLYAEQGKRVLMFTKDNLKDELLKIAKVKTGGTRNFQSMDLPSVYLERKYTGTIQVAMTRNRIEGACQVGINPVKEFHTLYDTFLRVSPLGVAGDFKRWDKHMLAPFLREAMGVLTEIAIRKKHPEESEKEIRNAFSVMIDQLINTMMIGDGFVYFVDKGLPSGSVLTAVLNSVINHILNLTVHKILINRHNDFYQTIAHLPPSERRIILIERYELEKFPEYLKATKGKIFKGVDKIIKASYADLLTNIRSVYYGDDEASAIKQEYIAVINFMTKQRLFMEKFGIEYDTPFKDGNHYYVVPIHQLNFLSRDFTYDEQFRCVTPSLKTVTLDGLLHFTTGDSVKQYLDNYTNVIREAALHSEEVYNRYKRVITRVVKKIKEVNPQIHFVIPSYKDIRSSVCSDILSGTFCTTFVDTNVLDVQSIQNKLDSECVPFLTMQRPILERLCDQQNQANSFGFWDKDSIRAVRLLKPGRGGTNNGLVFNILFSDRDRIDLRPQRIKDTIKHRTGYQPVDVNVFEDEVGGKVMAQITLSQLDAVLVTGTVSPKPITKQSGLSDLAKDGQIIPTAEQSIVQPMGQTVSNLNAIDTTKSVAGLTYGTWNELNRFTITPENAQGEQIFDIDWDPRRFKGMAKSYIDMHDYCVGGIRFKFSMVFNMNQVFQIGIGTIFNSGVPTIDDILMSPDHVIFEPSCDTRDWEVTLFPSPSYAATHANPLQAVVGQPIMWAVGEEPKGMPRLVGILNIPLSQMFKNESAAITLITYIKPDSTFKLFRTIMNRTGPPTPTTFPPVRGEKTLNDRRISEVFGLKFAFAEIDENQFTTEKSLPFFKTQEEDYLPLIGVADRTNHLKTTRKVEEEGSAYFPVGEPFGDSTNFGIDIGQFKGNRGYINYIYSESFDPRIEHSNLGICGTINSEGLANERKAYIDTFTRKICIVVGAKMQVLRATSAVIGLEFKCNNHFINESNLNAPFPTTDEKSIYFQTKVYTLCGQVITFHSILRCGGAKIKPQISKGNTISFKPQEFEVYPFLDITSTNMLFSFVDFKPSETLPVPYKTIHFTDFPTTIPEFLRLDRAETSLNAISQVKRIFQGVQAGIESIDLLISLPALNREFLRVRADKRLGTMYVNSNQSYLLSKDNLSDAVIRQAVPAATGSSLEPIKPENFVSRTFTNPTNIRGGKKIANLMPIATQGTSFLAGGLLQGLGGGLMGMAAMNERREMDERRFGYNMAYIKEQQRNHEKNMATAMIMNSNMSSAANTVRSVHRQGNPPPYTANGDHVLEKSPNETSQQKEARDESRTILEKGAAAQMYHDEHPLVNLEEAEYPKVDLEERIAAPEKTSEPREKETVPESTGPVSEPQIENKITNRTKFGHLRNSHGLGVNPGTKLRDVQFPRKIQLTRPGLKIIDDNPVSQEMKNFPQRRDPWA